MHDRVFSLSDLPSHAARPKGPCNVCGMNDSSVCDHPWMAIEWHSRHIAKFLDFVRDKVPVSVSHTYRPYEDTLRFDNAEIQKLWEVYCFGFESKGRG